MAHTYIIFDGECGFCNKTTMFVAKHDKGNNFILVSSLSNLGKNLLLQHEIKGLEISSIILLENECDIYTKSAAIRRILLKIPHYKIIGFAMFLSPKIISNYFYDLISKNRKKNKNTFCEIPNEKIRKRFEMK